MTLLAPSDLVFTLAERLSPARRADFLAIAGSGLAELPIACTEGPEGICIDFGLSAVVLGLVVVVLLLARAAVLVGWVRDMVMLEAGGACCVDTTGFRKD